MRMPRAIGGRRAPTRRGDGSGSPVAAATVVLVIVLCSVFAGIGAQAATASWHTATLPNVTDHPDSGLVNGAGPPYRLDWPGEGTSDTGAQDSACAATPPYRNGRRARTGSPDPLDELRGVLGIWKRGPFVLKGSATPGANHGGNHLAVFFHTPDLDGAPCFRGGTEYGFLRKLAVGSPQPGQQPLSFYQCANCNCKPQCSTQNGTVTERWVDQVTGWSNAQEDRIYRVSFKGFSTSSQGVRCTRSTDNFLIEVVNPVSWKIQHSERMCRASWMPDVAGASGWITANAHADTGLSDGQDDFTGSYNQVTGIKWLGP